MSDNLIEVGAHLKDSWGVDLESHGFILPPKKVTALPEINLERLELIVQWEHFCELASHIRNIEFYVRDTFVILDRFGADHEARRAALRALSGANEVKLQEVLERYSRLRGNKLHTTLLSIQNAGRVISLYDPTNASQLVARALGAFHFVRGDEELGTSSYDQIRDDKVKIDISNMVEAQAVESLKIIGRFSQGRRD